MHKKILFLFLLLILVAINWSIYKKEEQLKYGRLVYLELAPKDPRAFMLGDYMELRYVMKSKIYKALPKADNNRWEKSVNVTDGYVVVTIKPNNVAIFKSIYHKKPIEKNELLLEYRIRHGKLKFASNRFYFQEGKSELYDNAKYGAFRVNEKSEMLLVDLLDVNLSRIE